MSWSGYQGKAMTEFVGRTRELAALQRAFDSTKSQLIPVFGRRRVGKSELLLHFLESHRGIYFLGKESPETLQLRELMATAAQALDEPLLAAVSLAWKESLEAIVRQWKGTEKLVVILDEFQWMVQAMPELPSIVQELWDRQWQHENRVFVVLCGSYMGFMEREVLGSKSPLFGRRTAQIHLQPFGYQEARAFHPGYAAADAARTYFVCGGVPLYLKAFRDAQSVDANIRDAVMDEFSPLHREPDFLLREELRDVANYYGVLMALAAGATKAREIAQQTGLPERSLPYYLNSLVELGYVAKRFPLVGGSSTARHVRFVLEDPLLRFWFGFVYPNVSFVRQMGPQRSFDQLVRPNLPSWYGLAFERLCREALPVLYEREGVGAAFEVGEYWDKHVQIDVVGLRKDDWTDVGECKWGPVRSGSALAAEIGTKAARFPNSRGATLGLRAFVRTAGEGTRAALEKARVKVYELEDLYGE